MEEEELPKGAIIVKEILESMVRRKVLAFLSSCGKSSTFLLMPAQVFSLPARLRSTCFH
jgi:hypothetical protein